jgi:hypothetical protein
MKIDPDNRLLWKMKRRRLGFEALRDSVLAVSNGLNSGMYGPPVDLFGGNQSNPRRSVYGFIDRMDVSPLLTTFDFPNPSSSRPQRVPTTVPPQALYLMNNKFAADAAHRLAERMKSSRAKLDQADDAERIATIYRLLFAREPTADEHRLAGEFLAEDSDLPHWATYVHGLLMTNEFIFVD